jgi:hypothetical protein
MYAAGKARRPWMRKRAVTTWGREPELALENTGYRI